APCPVTASRVRLASPPPFSRAPRPPAAREPGRRTAAKRGSIWSAYVGGGSPPVAALPPALGVPGGARPQELEQRVYASIWRTWREPPTAQTGIEERPPGPKGEGSPELGLRPSTCSAK